MSVPRVGGGYVNLEMVHDEIIIAIGKDLEARKDKYDVNIKSNKSKEDNGYKTIMTVKMINKKGSIDNANLKF